MRMSFFPHEADPPLVIDADRMLTYAIALQRLEPVRRRYAQILKPSGVVDQTQLAERRYLDIRRQSPTPAAMPNGVRFAVGEAGDHANI
jgi:hypothetical protein